MNKINDEHRRAVIRAWRDQRHEMTQRQFCEAMTASVRVRLSARTLRAWIALAHRPQGAAPSRVVVQRAVSALRDAMTQLERLLGAVSRMPLVNQSKTAVMFRRRLAMACPRWHKPPRWPACRLRRRRPHPSRGTTDQAPVPTGVPRPGILMVFGTVRGRVGAFGGDGGLGGTGGFGGLGGSGAFGATGAMGWVMFGMSLSHLEDCDPRRASPASTTGHGGPSPAREPAASAFQATFSASTSTSRIEGSLARSSPARAINALASFPARWACRA